MNSRQFQGFFVFEILLSDLVNRNIRSLDDGSNISEEMTRQFEFMRDEIKDIKQQNQDLKDVVNQLNNLIQLKFSDHHIPAPPQKSKTEDSAVKFPQEFFEGLDGRSVNNE